MDKQHVYRWSDYEAIICYSRIFKTWRWSIESVSTEYVRIYSHMDLPPMTLEEAETDLFRTIYDRIGSSPDRKFTK